MPSTIELRRVSEQECSRSIYWATLLTFQFLLCADYSSVNILCFTYKQFSIGNIIPVKGLNKQKITKTLYKFGLSSFELKPLSMKWNEILKLK